MEQRDIIRMLNYPDKPLVDFSVSMANLTAPERECINLRVYDGETVESAAERLMLSPGTIKTRYRSGMQKLDSCWSSRPWINSILKQSEAPGTTGRFFALNLAGICLPVGWSAIKKPCKMKNRKGCFLWPIMCRLIHMGACSNSRRDISSSIR